MQRHAHRHWRQLRHGRLLPPQAGDVNVRQPDPADVAVFRLLSLRRLLRRLLPLLVPPQLLLQAAPACLACRRRRFVRIWCGCIVVISLRSFCTFRQAAPSDVAGAPAVWHVAVPPLDGLFAFAAPACIWAGWLGRASRIPWTLDKRTKRTFWSGCSPYLKRQVRREAAKWAQRHCC